MLFLLRNASRMKPTMSCRKTKKIAKIRNMWLELMKVCFNESHPLPKLTLLPSVPSCPTGNCFTTNDRKDCQANAKGISRHQPCETLHTGGWSCAEIAVARAPDGLAAILSRSAQAHQQLAYISLDGIQLLLHG